MSELPAAREAPAPADGGDGPLAYCEHKLAGAQAPAALALLFVPADRRRVLTGVHALEIELREIAERSSDPTVGRARAAWWAHELAATVDGDASHPVTRLLADGLGVDALARCGLDGALGRVAEHAAEPRPTARASEEYTAALGGACVRLALASAGASRHAGPWCARLGGARLAVEAALARPGADLAAAALAIEGTPAAVPEAARADVVDQLVLTALARDAARRGRRAGPLRRLWLAWRTAVRARRPPATTPTGFRDA